jgi:hypothetical protein
MLLGMASTSRLLALAVLLLAACGEDRPNVPGAPVNGGSRVVGGDDLDAGPRPDSGAGRDAGDGSVPATSCERVPVVRSVGEDTSNITSTETPADFLVARQAEKWNSDCTNPKLIVELSDGTCPDGFGHQLALAFDVNDIQDGAVHVGNNAVLAESDASSIQARYTRPDLLTPAGTWGTCEGATGLVVFLEPPDLSAGAILRFEYMLNLTPCDSMTTVPMLMVSGSVKLQLRYQLSEFCPSRPM